MIPSACGVISSRSIATASPGSAPRTSTGPATGASGWPSHAGVNGVGTSRMSRTSANAPRTTSVTSSPESMVRAGGVSTLTEKRYQVLGSAAGRVIARAAPPLGGVRRRPG